MGSAEAAWNRAPFNWTRKRKLRWSLALTLAILAYPVLVTLALWSGFVEWFLKSEDVRLEIQNPAYTIWPGKVHLGYSTIPLPVLLSVTPTASISCSRSAWAARLDRVTNARAEPLPFFSTYPQTPRRVRRVVVSIA